MGKLLGNITQPNVESRHLHLAVAIESVIDGAVHLDEKILRGTVLGKAANGKYRAYAEGTVAAGGDITTGAATFTIENPANVDLMKHIRVGDVLEDVAGNELGTVLTFDSVTGAGTFAANSSANLAAGEKLRIKALSIAKADVRILKSEVLVEDGADSFEPGWFEGFFNTAVVLGASDAALTAMGAKIISSTEFRLI